MSQATNANGTETSRWRASHVRDFAWVADPRYRVKQTTWGSVRITYLYFERDEQAVVQGLGLAVKALEYFSTHFGPYPYLDFTVAEVAAITDGTGIEYPQLIMVSRDVHRLSTFLSAYDTILVHEIAHQWWYGLVGNDEVNEAWLDEGFATYSERRFMRDTRGGAPPLFRWPKPLAFLPSPTDRDLSRFLYVSQARVGFDRRIRQPSAAFDDRLAYAVAVYEKAAFVLEMLEDLVGRDTMDAILRRYADQYRYGVARSADFIRVADTVSGRDLTAFFESWLDTTRICDYRVDGVHTRSAGDGYASTVRLRRVGAIVMPVDVRVVLEDGTTITRRWDGQARETTLDLHTSSPVRRVDVDPDQRLLETDRVNNHYPRKRQVTWNPLVMRKADRYTIGLLPFAWYDRGVEVGGLIATGYRPDLGFPYDVRLRQSLLATFSRNLARDTSRVTWSYNSPTPWLGRRTLGRLAGVARPGDTWASADVRWFLGSHFYRGPVQVIQLAASHERLTEDPHAAPDRGPFSPGTVRSVEVRYTFHDLTTDFFPRWGQLVEIAVEGASADLGSDWTFARVTARSEVYRPMWPQGTLAVNLFQGTASADTPPQHGMRLTQEGRFRSSALDQVWGRSLTALNLELRVTPTLGAPLAGAVFLNLGKYWGRITTASTRVVREAGLGVRLFDNAWYAVQIDWPLWLGGPGPGRTGFGSRGIEVRVGPVFGNRPR